MSLKNLPNQLDYVLVEKCRLCGSTDLSVVLDLPDTPFGDRYLPLGQGAEHANLIPLKIVQCEACNNFQTSVVVNVNSMYEHYLSRPAPVNTILSADYTRYAEHIDTVLNLNTEDLVVEIGSNDGFFASHFARKGIRCIGVDPAQNLSQIALDRGVQTISSFFTTSISEDILAEFGTAKLIVSNMVLANVPNLDNFMKGVKNLLAEDGLYAIETNYALDVVESLQLEVINHEHITYFSVKSLSSYLEKFDLEIFLAKRVPSKSGALRCYVKHKGAKYQIDDSVLVAQSFESDYGLFLPSSWKPLFESIEHGKVAVQKFFDKTRKSEVVGYGTSIGATTILYALRAGQYLSALIDDDPFRQGLHSPGYSIPVVSREKIFAGPSEVKFCPILAPRYVNQILRKNESVVSAGVIFIRVWPFFEKLPNTQWLKST